MHDKLFDLSGRVAIVTGGAGLLGRQHGHALASFGAQVVVADVDEARCAEVADELTHGTGSKASALTVDVADRASVDALTRRVMEQFGRIDVLVNNAATKSAHFFAPFEEFPLPDWNEVLAVNLTGAFLCAQRVGREMVWRGAGSIINIASIYGVVGPDPRIYEQATLDGRAINTPAVYAASKAGVLGLTRYLATYWADKGVRVNGITPGGVYSGQNERFVENYSSRVPLGRMARQDELQGAVVFLASDASSYVTGHNLVVDGGWTVW